ncbi:MAG: hypothetical protein K0Q71_2930 [Thermomicrobiales bacterium]|nr:hypothetical protein [Thermomicrobiales bacterium]
MAQKISDPISSNRGSVWDPGSAPMGFWHARRQWGCVPMRQNLVPARCQGQDWAVGRGTSRHCQESSRRVGADVMARRLPREAVRLCTTPSYAHACAFGELLGQVLQRRTARGGCGHVQRATDPLVEVHAPRRERDACSLVVVKRATHHPGVVLCECAGILC